jgi:hypothetical protein
MVNTLLRTCLCVFVLSATAACTSEASDPEVSSESAELTGSPWHAVLHCGGGGLVVDVDQSERRHIQVVVRDHAAVRYLASHPGDGPPGIPTARGELLITGWVSGGVFQPHDFHGLVQSGYAAADAYLPEARVAREGEGVRVRLVTWASGHEVETSNWFFAGCQ